MSSVLGERFRSILLPPRYLALPRCGIDVSTSSIKAVCLRETVEGLKLEKYLRAPLPSGTVREGEVIDPLALARVLSYAAHELDIHDANAAVSIALLNFEEGKQERSARIQDSINDLLMAFDRQAITIHALEDEGSAMARALLPHGDMSTTLLIDIGKATTKLIVVSHRQTRFAIEVRIGGHTLTRVAQKHFGITEAEARKIKAEDGIIEAERSEHYHNEAQAFAASLGDVIAPYVMRWQEQLAEEEAEPITQVILTGGDASVRGLSEFLEKKLGIPTASGNAFRNLAPLQTWLPDMDYTDSLSYATAIGLALRGRTYA